MKDVKGRSATGRFGQAPGCSAIIARQSKMHPTAFRQPLLFLTQFAHAQEPCMHRFHQIVTAVAAFALTCACWAAPPVATSDAEKAAKSAKLLINNKDYAGARAVLVQALKAKPDGVDLLFLAATCEENLGNTAGARKLYEHCVSLLGANPAGADRATAQQAAAGVKRLDETDKLVAKYAGMLEDEADRQRRQNERASAVLDRAAQLLRTSTTAAVEGLRNAPSKPAKTAVMSLAEFQTKYADAFPRENNLSPGGRAQASSTHPALEDPDATLIGVRKVSTWGLDGGQGWLLAEWPAPIGGRYILLFNRPTGGDNWRSATVEVNGREAAKIGEAKTGTVIVVDLGEVIAIKSIRVSITGFENCGITGLEVHRPTR
jgi:hypothetical protein